MPTEPMSAERKKFETWKDNWWRTEDGAFCANAADAQWAAWQACLAAQGERTQALVAAAGQAALERVFASFQEEIYPQAGEYAGESADRWDWHAKDYLSALKRTVASLSTGNALDLERAKARLDEALEWSAMALNMTPDGFRQWQRERIAALSGEAKEGGE